MKYTLFEKHNVIILQWGVDFHKEHEVVLVQECGDVPLFVTDYPSQIKPFYSRSNEDGQTVSF